MSESLDGSHSSGGSGLVNGTVRWARSRARRNPAGTLIVSIAAAMLAGAGVGAITGGPGDTPAPESPDAIAPATGDTRDTADTRPASRTGHRFTPRDRVGPDAAGTGATAATTQAPADPATSAPASAPPPAPGPGTTPDPPSSPSTTREPSPTNDSTKEPAPSPSEPDGPLGEVPDLPLP